MEEVMLNQLLMRRPNLLDLPTMPELPEGFVLRVAESADEPALANLLEKAFEDSTWTAERVRSTLTGAENVTKTFVIATDNEIVATASCRLLPDIFPGSGYVHYVAANSNHAGKGLGFCATLATLIEFSKLGLEDAVLETDDHRFSAIKTYRKLGFEPVFREDSHVERWKKIEELMGSPLNG